MHLSRAGQSPRQAGNSPVHGSKVVLVVDVVGDRVVVVVAGSVLVVGGRVVVVTVVEVVGGPVVVVVAGSVLVVGGRVLVVTVVEVVAGRVVVVGSVLVVDGRVALVVVVEVVVVDLVLSGQTKRRPLSCSALATVPSRSASCCVRSRHGGHMPRAVSLRAVCS